MQRSQVQSPIRRKNGWFWVRDVFVMFLGCLIAALSINIFFIPVRLTMGGLSGIVSIIYHLTDKGEFLPFGIMFLILNIPLLVMGYLQISFSLVWRSIVGTIIYSLTIDLTEPMLAGWFTNYINRPLESGGPDPLIYCLFGGVLYGIGLGMIFRSRFTTGGTDILALVIKKKFKTLSTGQFLMILDAIIVLSTLIAYRNKEDPAILLAMYSFIAMYLTAKTFDIVLEGFEYCRTAYIISDKSDEISNQILTRLHRGVTGLQGEGMYTGDEKRILLCVLSKKQIPDLKAIVGEIDPGAFVVVVEAREVLGEGFGSEREF